MTEQKIFLPLLRRPKFPADPVGDEIKELRELGLEFRRWLKSVDIPEF